MFQIKRSLFIPCFRFYSLLVCKKIQSSPLKFDAIRTKYSEQKVQESVKFRLLKRQSLSSSTVTSNLVKMKLDTPEFHALFTPELNVLISLFDKHGYELRIAGGAVRDLLMGKQPQDVDFATTATPDEMKAMFEKEGIRMLNMKGEKHGTITCRINDKENFEVTTLRIDVVTDGRHAEVEFTKDWELDSLRRDLTINSMFLDFEGTVYDYFNGKEHLDQRKVFFVGDPQSRIREDYLRILRYFRFYGRIATEPDCHDKVTLETIKKNMDGLSAISGERIWLEVKKILTGNHADSVFKVMISLGLSKYLGLPDEIDVTAFEIIYNRCHHLHPHPMTLLSAIMVDETQVRTLNDRVKLSKDELRTGIFIINHRNDDPGTNKFKYCQDLLCDSVGKEPKTKDKISELLKYWGDSDTLDEFSKWDLPKFPVNGHKLIERGIKKGPMLAKTLNALRQIWKESGYTLTEDDLLDHLDKIKDTVT